MTARCHVLSPIYRHAGFTVLELVATLAIAAVTMAAVLPAASEFVREHRVAAAAERFASALTLARTSAMARRVHVTVAPLGKGWEDGWRVFAEQGQPDGKLGGGDVLILHEDRLSSDLASVLPAPSTVAFTPIGRLFNASSPGAHESIGFRIEAATRLVEIGALGQVRICIPASKSLTCK